jgi:MFS family permease
MSLLIRNPSFRFLFSASAISNLGDGIAALALPWLATLITRDPLLISLVAVAGRLPWFLLAIPVGVLTDRADRRRLIVQADLIRVVLTLAIMVLALSAPRTPPEAALPQILALSVLAFLLGAAEVLRDNAAQTLLPAIVQPGDLERANGQIWSVEQVMGSFVGPPLAGVLIAFALPAPFALEAVAFAVAAALVWMIALPPRKPTGHAHPIQAAREGWRWMRGAPTILRLAIMLGLMNALHMMALTILVLFSQDILGLSAAQHGVLLTAGAAGGVFGGLVGPRIVARLGQTGSALAALALMPLQMIAIALTDSVAVVAAALFIGLVSALIWNLTTVSYRQRLIPDAMLGRVNSLYRFFGWGMMPLGAFAGGWVVAVADPVLGHDMALRLPFALAAAGLVAMLGYALARLRL